MELKAAILIISDTAFNDPSTDRAAAAIEEAFAGEKSSQSQWIIKDNMVVPDNIDAIREHITMFCDEDQDYMNLVVTTGGTGFACKDVTPEAIKPMLDRGAPGLV